MTKAALDYETKRAYTVTVTANDSTSSNADASASITVTIHVTNEDEAPTIMVGSASIDLSISGPASPVYAENGTAPVATYMLAGTNAASATWSVEGDDAGDFTISSGGMLRFMSSPDYEMPDDTNGDNIYMVTVKASDGTDMDTHEVTVTVIDVAEAPPVIIDLSISGQTSPVYAENRTGAVATYTVAGTNAASATWSLEGTDAVDFTISSGGVLRFRDSPDHEMPADNNTDNIYMVTVNASDGTDMATHEVTVTVTNVNEVPTIEGDATIDYAENGMGDVATFTAMDPEEATISWSHSGADAGDFTISGGVLRFLNSPDHEMPADNNTDNIYMVTVNASDGTDMATHEVTVTVTNVNEVPTIEGDATIDYAENGMGDVATFTAMDPEEATISWSHSGADAGDFTISGGVLRFLNSPDYEMPADAGTDNIYMVTVEASDGTNMATHEVIVTVTDVDDTIVGEDLLDRYDADDSGHIELSEVNTAIDHFFGGGLTLLEVNAVIDLFFQ